MDKGKDLRNLELDTLELLNDLIEWTHAMGGWEAPVWKRALVFRRKLRERTINQIQKQPSKPDQEDLMKEIMREILSVTCPRCHTEFDVQVWRDDKCPKCGNTYWWEEIPGLFWEEEE